MRAPSFRAGGSTTIGVHPNRRTNDDYLLLDRELGLFAVFDGGGSWNDGPSPAGPMSADIFRRVFGEALETEPDSRSQIERAFRDATEQLRTPTAGDDWGWHASVVLAVACFDRVLISWVGDAMGYRVTSDRIEPLTRSHTFANELIRQGRTTDAAIPPNFRNVLCHVLGGELPNPLEIVSLAPLPGDRLVLATDGVTDHIATNTILSTCRAISDPTTCAEAIIEHAIMVGSRDNCTCAVIAFERPGDGPSPKPRPPSVPRAWWQFWK